MYFSVAVLLSLTAVVIGQECGQAASPGPLATQRWPWEVEVTTWLDGKICTGTAISGHWVLTAGHCCQYRDASEITLQTAEGRVVNVEELVLHPQFADGILYTNDICLLRSEGLSSTTPACLPTEFDLADNFSTECYTNGWGVTSEGTQLLKSAVTPVDQYTCNNAYGGIIGSDIICANENGNTCQKDNGAPLICRDPSTQSFKVLGVTSYVPVSCTLSEFPLVFARTSNAISWIQEVITKSRR